MRNLCLVLVLGLASTQVRAVEITLPQNHDENCARFLRALETQAEVVDPQIITAFADGRPEIPMLFVFARPADFEAFQRMINNDSPEHDRT